MTQQTIQMSQEQVQQALAAALEVIAGRADSQRILSMTGQIENAKHILAGVISGQVVLAPPPPPKPAEPPATPPAEPPK